MTDRELLERAAAAAEIELRWPTDPITYTVVAGVSPRRTDNWDSWNPLTDDGDALRLAVRLRMTVRLEDPAAAIAGWAENQHVPFTSDGKGPWYWKEWGRVVDPYAATRRAIVRAAAAMPPKP